MLARAPPPPPIERLPPPLGRAPPLRIPPPPPRIPPPPREPPPPRRCANASSVRIVRQPMSTALTRRPRPIHDCIILVPRCHASFIRRHHFAGRSTVAIRIFD